MTDPNEAKVRNGYDTAAQRYNTERNKFDNRRYLEQFVTALPENATVLDLGCGSGVPIDRYLVDRGCEVVGIDISPEQVALATQRVPEASYSVRSMSELSDGDYDVDGIVSFYSIFHTPRETHAALFRRLNSYLPRGGVLLVTMGADPWEGTEPDFHGVEMSWSHYGAERNREIIEQAGFVIDIDEVDHAGGERHQMLLAHKLPETT